jgi:starch phosphorylase
MTRDVINSQEIDYLVAGLHQVARNLWWTWNQDAQELFQALSPRAWQTMYHNAVAVLKEVSDYELRVRLQDRTLAKKARTVLEEFQRYMSREHVWARVHAPELLTRPVAYFCAEFGFHETLPIAAGGLGVLAADHAKSASDLGISFVGITLFYREGYFQQAIGPDGWQTEYYNLLKPENLPMELVVDNNGHPIVCSVEIGFSQVYFHAWRVNVGRSVIYLLDADRPENEQRYRDLTLHVYGGDSTTRIMQELLLGIGGVRLLRALGIRPAVFHINEGHPAFAMLELLREHLTSGLEWDQAIEATRDKCIFTTHTPVEAGHDRFSPDLVEFAMHRYKSGFPVGFHQILGLGRVNPQDSNEPFCMTVLALKLSRAANAVSELHGKVTRKMWRALYPDVPEDKVPIGYITNGVHLLGWMKGPVRRFWYNRLQEYFQTHPAEAKARFGSNVDAESGECWDLLVNTREFWELLADPEFISDEELWAFHYNLKREMIEFIRRRLFQQHQKRYGEYIQFEELLDPDTLTVGFGRRFATYKRPALVFSRLDKIIELVKDPKHPIQFVFAGKAHPRDDEGKRLVQYIVNLSQRSELRKHLVFVENYDIHVCRHMVAGCDVWLNNPRRPLEASGTSGMKAACNGVLNLSIMDGWWREAYDGLNGFAIGPDLHPPNIEEQDRVDAENLYNLLTQEVIPCYYTRDQNGIPREWIKRMRRAFVTIAPRFNTWRMVQEYTLRYYLRR